MKIRTFSIHSAVWAEQKRTAQELLQMPGFGSQRPGSPSQRRHYASLSPAAAARRGEARPGLARRWHGGQPATGARPPRRPPAPAAVLTGRARRSRCRRRRARHKAAPSASSTPGPRMAAAVRPQPMAAAYRRRRPRPPRPFPRPAPRRAPAAGLVAQPHSNPAPGTPAGRR